MQKNKIEKKERHFSVVGLIFAFILIIGIGVGSFFLYRYVIGPAFDNFNNPTEPATSNDSEVKYNKLLTILNDGLEPSEEKASSLLSFSYQSEHFFISGKTTSKVYSFDIDIGVQENTNKALDFVITSESLSLFDREMSRYNQTSSTDFNNRYLTSGVTGKHSVGNQGAVNRVFATLRSGNQITVINNVDLSTALDESYTSIKINAGEPLFKIYNYIVTK